ncbi:hypothetical protein FA95DRAFT_1610216 [Auriscalpium vulgare]|uniref:Uncharacterized protein n=1 Tax=Auriscalpium vulgare TaxID=40419 RepID=A0ACB8RDZ1_9AGAM|nr:hypothetical protein FA95DRAFT_1610216 [Auriscalpium vulgare]
MDPVEFDHAAQARLDPDNFADNNQVIPITIVFRVDPFVAFHCLPDDVDMETAMTFIGFGAKRFASQLGHPMADILSGLEGIDIKDRNHSIMGDLADKNRTALLHQVVPRGGSITAVIRPDFSAQSVANKLIEQQVGLLRTLLDDYPALRDKVDAQEAEMAEVRGENDELRLSVEALNINAAVNADAAAAAAASRDELRTNLDRVTGELEQVRTANEALVTKAANLTAQVDTLTAQVDTLTTEVNTLTAHAAEQDTNVANLTTRVDDLQLIIDFPLVREIQNVAEDCFYYNRRLPKPHVRKTIPNLEAIVAAIHPRFKEHITLAQLTAAIPLAVQPSDLRTLQNTAVHNRTYADLRDALDRGNYPEEYRERLETLLLFARLSMPAEWSAPAPVPT